MIRHLVAFRFRDDIPESERQALLDELASFPRRFPAMRRWALGENISRRDQTFTHAFTVEFAEEAELVAYLDSEEHEEFVRLRWRPLIADRAIVSFEAPQSPS